MRLSEIKTRKIPVCSLLAALCAFDVQAIPAYSVSGAGLVAATAAEAAYLTSLSGGYTTEDFESFTAGLQNPSYITSVGTFTRLASGSGGACDDGPYDCTSGLGILNAATTPFSGRFAISPDNWLDSFDATKMRFDLDVLSANTVGFYITDPNDQGARMDFKLKDGTLASYLIDDIFGSSKSSGAVHYLSFYDPTGIDSIKFIVDKPADGYGIDNVTVANVPEPGSLALLGLGLLGLSIARRNVRQTG